MANLKKNQKAVIFFISIAFAIFSFAGVANAGEAHDCGSSTSNCRSICQGDLFYDCWGWGYCCTTGYKPGSIAVGGQCVLQTDCAAGLYCHDRGSLLDDRCRAKAGYFQTCGNGLDLNQPNCLNGCAAGTTPEGVAYPAGTSHLTSDAESGANFWSCGPPPAAPAPAPETTPGPQVRDDTVPGELTPESNRGIIQCGRPGQRMCHLCDIILTMHTIVDYLLKIGIGVALLAISIGGVMYIISSGESALMETAKKTIKTAILGFILLFTANLIIGTTIRYIGTNENLGINVTGWNEFECGSRAADH